jgi:hypothetical protein
MGVQCLLAFRTQSLPYALFLRAAPGYGASSRPYCDAVASPFPKSSSFSEGSRFATKCLWHPAIVLSLMNRDRGSLPHDFTLSAKRRSVDAIGSSAAKIRCNGSR